MGGYSDFNMLADRRGPIAGICHPRGSNAAIPAQWLIYIVVSDLDGASSARYGWPKLERAPGRACNAPGVDSATLVGMSRARDPLRSLRKIVLAWPETSERLSHGAPTFWGGKKTFASLHDDHHGDGRVAVWCKASHELQEELVRADPEIFFVPPYVGPSGWIGIRLDRDVDWGVIGDLLERGYRMVAPKRAIARLDADRAHR